MYLLHIQVTTHVKSSVYLSLHTLSPDARSAESQHTQLLYAANMQVFMHAKLPHAPCVSQPIHVNP